MLVSFPDYFMLADFQAFDQPSPTVLRSPLVTVTDATCLVLALSYNASHIEFQIGVAETEPILDNVENIRRKAFGDPMTSSEQSGLIEASLPRGRFHIVLRTFAKNGYIKIDYVHTKDGHCHDLDGMFTVIRM